VESSLFLRGRLRIDAVCRWLMRIRSRRLCIHGASVTYVWNSQPCTSGLLINLALLRAVHQGSTRNCRNGSGKSGSESCDRPAWALSVKHSLRRGACIGESRGRLFVSTFRRLPLPLWIIVWLVSRGLPCWHRESFGWRRSPC